MVGCYMPLRHSVVPSGVSWLSKWQAIKALHRGVELWQKCVLFLLFIIVCIDWIDKCNKMMSLPRQKIEKSVVCYVQMI